MPIPRVSDEDAWALYARAIGHRVRAARERKGLSQDRAAAESGISRTHFQRIEQGMGNGSAANPSLRTFARIASALGVEARELLPPSNVGEDG
ncbi:helix-turn-helix domain-containing protein [Cryobacterium breve]|uniref:Helix-turn-helix domain-containing protein n=1 Tax=Cryobacterium breve TaxID=1259258 RepID=A0ABY7NH49_9MICO|nr:helix-turn-helix domain-containing protein [Cryobacterium breve]